MLIAVLRAAVFGDQHIGRLTNQLRPPVTEQFFRPFVHQNNHAGVIDHNNCVGRALQQTPDIGSPLFERPYCGVTAPMNHGSHRRQTLIRGTICWLKLGAPFSSYTMSVQRKFVARYLQFPAATRGVKCPDSRTFILAPCAFLISFAAPAQLHKKQLAFGVTSFFALL